MVGRIQAFPFRMPILLAGVAIYALAAQPPEPNRDEGNPERRNTFVEVAASSGVDFRHDHGGSDRKYTVETMGAGGCFLDFDGDSWPDLYLVQGASLPGRKQETPLRNRLYRNRRDGTFVDVTDRAGVGDTGYGMGCSSGDIDNDGDVDLFVTNFGANVLYENRGDGTFRNVTDKAGVGDPLWGTSSAFADFDNDGDLDLYLCNYVDFTLATNRWCGDFRRGLKSYCHPDVYDGQPDRLYRNNGDGTFTDIARQAGVHRPGGKGLGVVWSDYDLDGFVDIYVANDSTPNFLFRNNGDGTFTETTLLAGVGYSEDGRAEAGMGTDFGDVDNDGDFDLVVTNLSGETNSLYRNNGEGTFDNVTFGSGLGEISFSYVGFGTGFLDYDNDGDLDLVVVNGHVMDDIEDYNDAVTYAEPDFLFDNRGDGTFREVSRQVGKDFRRPAVGRGLAVADFDRDGDLDLLITGSREPARLLRNDGVGAGHWVQVELQGTRANRSGVGARIVLEAGGDRQVREIRAGSSYLSQNQLGAHFGLGKTKRIDRIEVFWPGGGRDILLNLPADTFQKIRQGSSPAGKNR